MSVGHLGLILASTIWEPLFPRPDITLLPPPPKTAQQEVRVLIFPHTTTLPPQGRDTVIDRTALVTAGTCQARTASGSLLQSGQRIAFEAATLTQTLEITCDAPARVERSGGATEYAYRGDFTVRRGKFNGSPTVEIINTLPLESYLRGVVPIEMPASWSPEALRAQAIAARTYALFHLALTAIETPGRGWDFDDTVMYQAYTGTRDESPATDDAIATTDGIHMTYQSQVIQAFFSADAGGHTENAENIWTNWGRVPYCRGKPETFSRSSLDPARWGYWTVELTWAEISKRLGISNITQLLVRSDETSKSGRAIWVRVTAGQKPSRKQVIRLWGDEARRKLRLRSTRLSTRATATGIAFRGIGYGHGVGMSQVGAQVLASTQGATAEEILGFYYTDVTLSR